MESDEVDCTDLDAEIAVIEAKKLERLAATNRARQAKEEEQSRILIQATPTKGPNREKDHLPSIPAQPKFSSKSSSSNRPTEALQPLPAEKPSTMSARLAASRQKSSSAETLHANRHRKSLESSSFYGKQTASASSDVRDKQHPGSTNRETFTNVESIKPRPVQQLPSLPPVKTKPVGGDKFGFPTSSSRLSHPAAPSMGARTRSVPPRATERPRSRSSSLEVEDKPLILRRDDIDSTLIEELEIGPREFGTDPEGEEEWLGVEPNSGIRLRKRITSHADVQEFLSNRYYLPPSKLYSVVRLSRDGTSYDVPVDEDWVTIAVVAQRGPIKVSGTKEKRVGSDQEDDGGDSEEDMLDEDDDDDDGDEGEDQEDVKPFFSDVKVENLEKERPSKKVRKSGKKKDTGKDDWKKRREPRKYVNLTLFALPPRSHGSTSTTGDAILQLLLFEADCIVRMEDEDGEIVKSYRGGSGGAYEKWCNLAEGSVIAIMNPRVWRNIRGGSTKPHPMEFPMGFNPVSDDSIIHIGSARDIGRCSAVQRDGNRCKSWVDLRQGQVCEYHVHAAVKRGKSSRGEFTASTAPFEMASAPNKPRPGFSNNAAIMPRFGRPPSGVGASRHSRGVNDGGGATYVVGGGVVNTNRSFADEDVSTVLGRNRARKGQRKQEKEEAEKELQRLFQREKGVGGGTTGGKYLEEVRKAAGDESDLAQEALEEEDRKRVFSAEAIKRIGYDPSAKRGQFSREEDKKRLSAIADLDGMSSGCRMERHAKRVKEERRERKNGRLVIPNNHIQTAKVVPPKRQDHHELIDLD